MFLVSAVVDAVVVTAVPSSLLLWLLLLLPSPLLFLPLLLSLWLWLWWLLLLCLLSLLVGLVAVVARSQDCKPCESEYPSPRCYVLYVFVGVAVVVAMCWLACVMLLRVFVVVRRIRLSYLLHVSRSVRPHCPGRRCCHISRGAVPH